VNRLSVFLLFGAIAAAQKSAPKAAEPLALPPGLYAKINTSVGVITARLYDTETPKTVLNFMALAEGAKPWLDPKTKKMVQRPLYQNLIFHRVIPQFMIQTGDPTETGSHDCGVSVPDEIIGRLNFDRPGRLAMANTGAPGTAGCQFFITEEKYTAGNGKYTIFGQVVDGQPLVAKISHVIRDDKDKPNSPTKLINITFIKVSVKEEPAKDGDAPKPPTDPKP
jgi:peptidyl-prolyl cis-trans isomerase A (cyclophilin A)